MSAIWHLVVGVEDRVEMKRGDFDGTAIGFEVGGGLRREEFDKIGLDEDVVGTIKALGEGARVESPPPHTGTAQLREPQL